MKYICVILMTIVMLGCVSHGNDSLRQETEVSVNQKITAGVTTKEDIRSLFGSPISTSYTDNGFEIWKYALAKSQLNAASYIPIVSIFAGGTHGVNKELTILFDENEIVKKFNMSESKLEGRTGLLNQ